MLVILVFQKSTFWFAKVKICKNLIIQVVLGQIWSNFGYLSVSNVKILVRYDENL